MLKVKNAMLLVGLAVLFFTAGCTLFAKGEYKEGTYFGYDEETGTTAVVLVNSSGIIEDILLDQFAEVNCSIITDTEGKETATCMPTSKRILGLSEGTFEDLPWYKQADLFAAEVVSQQNLEWVEFRYMDSESKIVETMPEGQDEEDMIYIDNISGVTYPVINMYNAILDALEEAK